MSRHTDYIDMQCEIQVTASLMRFGVRFGVTTVLLTVVLPGQKVVPENLQCKHFPASASFIL